MRVLVRPARVEDLPDVARVTVDAYVGDGLVPADHSYVDELRDVHGRAAHATLLVAEDGGAVVGTVTVARPGTAFAEIAEPHEAELRMVAVDPSARRRGVGEALVRAGLDVATAAGAQSVALTTLDTMHSAHRLYERLGFRRDPRRDRSVDGYALLVYTVALSSDRSDGGVRGGPPARDVGR